MKKTALESKTKKELLDIAKGLKIKKGTALKKPDLISLIKKNQAEIPQNIQGISDYNPIENNTATSWSAHHVSEQEMVEDSKYYEGFIQQAFPEPKWTLPQKYGDTKAVLMVRDPNWLYSYWEINDDTVSTIINRIGEKVYAQCVTILRSYDVTDVVFDGVNAHSFADVNVGDADRWYLHVPDANRSYCIEVGYLTPDGKFIAAVRSNTITAPRESVSEVIDEEWMSVEGKTYFDKMYALSGGLNVGASSGELAGERKQLLTQKLEGMLNLSSEELIPGVTSLSSPIGQQQPQEKQKDFWLIANTELIVYGATEPDASVTVCGQPVKLRKDGTFCLRFALPDGQQLIPIKATDKDGDQHRQIEFKVNRKQK
ncbi:DUF4912 domain-containing protein [Candidatus Margulisiibacteriota bacterium]